MRTSHVWPDKTNQTGRAVNNKPRQRTTPYTQLASIPQEPMHAESETWSPKSDPTESHLTQRDACRKRQGSSFPRTSTCWTRWEFWKCIHQTALEADGTTHSTNNIHCPCSIRVGNHVQNTMVSSAIQPNTEGKVP